MGQKFKPQFMRLLAIDNALRGGGRVNSTTLRKLPELCELSRKTIQREIDYLRFQIGAPIEYDKHRKSYYYTDPNYSLTNVRLDEGDLFAIMIAEKLLDQYEGTPVHAKLTATFDKIREFLPDTVLLPSADIKSRYSFFFPAKARQPLKSGKP